MKQLLLGALLCALLWSSSTASSASSQDIEVPVVCTHEFWGPAFDHGGKTLEDYMNWLTPHFSDKMVGEFGSQKVGTLLFPANKGSFVNPSSINFCIRLVKGVDGCRQPTW